MKRRPYPPDIQTEVANANRERREVKLTEAQMAKLGHTKRPLLKCVREMCTDCMSQNLAEVRRCTSVGCPLWPLRMGTNPWHKRRSD